MFFFVEENRKILLLNYHSSYNYAHYVLEKKAKFQLIPKTDIKIAFRMTHLERDPVHVSYLLKLQFFFLTYFFHLDFFFHL